MLNQWGFSQECQIYCKLALAAPRSGSFYLLLNIGIQSICSEIRSHLILLWYLISSLHDKLFSSCNVIGFSSVTGMQLLIPLLITSHYTTLPSEKFWPMCVLFTSCFVLVHLNSCPQEGRHRAWQFSLFKGSVSAISFWIMVRAWIYQIQDLFEWYFTYFKTKISENF